MSKPSARNEIIVHPVGGGTVNQRTRDGHIDATGMCQAAGKTWDHYWTNKRSKAFARALEADTGIPVSELIQVVKGGNPHRQGTWVHPRVAIHLGQWLSVEFQIWVTGVVEDYDRMRRLLGQAPADWSKRIPDKFWQEIYRLKGWRWPGMGTNRYSVVGAYFVDLVYDRLVAPGLTESIELDIPRRVDGSHAVKMHQMLVATVGIPVLQRHVEILLILMDRQADWIGFMFAVNQTLPKVRHRLSPPKSDPPEQGRLF